MAKYTKADLKALMREKLAAKTTKIESPLAAYDSSGQLTCRVCLTVQKESSWSAHLLSQQHKESIERLKKKPKREDEVVQTPKGVKRQAGKLSNPVLPPKKSLTIEPAQPVRSAIAVSEPMIAKREPMVIKREPMVTKREPMVTKREPMVTEQEPMVTEQEPEEPQTSNGPQTELPAGFFDDPIRDAKERNVEYKDSMEEEWVKFQKVMTSEGNRAETMVQDELEETQRERTVEEIDEQLNSWQKIDRLQKKIESIKSSKTRSVPSSSKSSTSVKIEDEPEDENEDFGALLDWRTRRNRK